MFIHVKAIYAPDCHYINPQHIVQITDNNAQRRITLVVGSGVRTFETVEEIYEKIRKAAMDTVDNIAKDYAARSAAFNSTSEGE